MKFSSNNLHRGTTAVAALLMLAGCATPPPPAPREPTSYLVLLENADGSTGQVIVNGPKGSTVLNKAGLGAELDGSSSKPFVVNTDKLTKDFGAAMAAKSVPPKTFLLYFEAGGAKLTSESAALIPNILSELGHRPAPDLSVIGHTDTAGDATANEALGLTRAQQISQLINAGKSLTIEVTSHGERNLLVQTPDNTAEPKNRRVEVTVR
jgi:peptidoglycan-associated lipoprotein